MSDHRFANQNAIIIRSLLVFQLKIVSLLALRLNRIFVHLIILVLIVIFDLIIAVVDLVDSCSKIWQRDMFFQMHTWAVWLFWSREISNRHWTAWLRIFRMQSRLWLCQSFRGHSLLDLLNARWSFLFSLRNVRQWCWTRLRALHLFLLVNIFASVCCWH